jgi:hypothetical protein
MLQKMFLNLIIVSFAFPGMANAICYNGRMSIWLGPDDNGAEHSVNMSVKIELPEKTKSGLLVTEILNADEPHILARKGITKVSQIISPDHLELVDSPFTPRCPCNLLESTDHKVMLSLERGADGEIRGRFSRYFNLSDREISDIQSCDAN